jgi:ribosomal protein L11 methylase PrmA
VKNTTNSTTTFDSSIVVGLSSMENDIIHIVGRKKTFERANVIEILFKQVEDMSKVVKVCLKLSTIVVTEQFNVMVRYIGEQLWLNLWKETKFVPMNIIFPKPPLDYKLHAMCNLTPKESLERFGVGLEGSKTKNMICM